jgi:hypothetical protein
MLTIGGITAQSRALGSEKSPAGDVVEGTGLRECLIATESDF